MDGIYFRILNEDCKWEAKQLTDMTPDERRQALEDFKDYEILRVIDRLCDVINMLKGEMYGEHDESVAEEHDEESRRRKEQGTP